MKIIYSICSWGLGHATRSLPVIRKLLQENNELTIISNGRSLTLLKKELGENIEYVDIPDYPILLSENSHQFMAKSMIYWPKFIHRMESGLRQLNRLLKKQHYDLIISDGRYDMYSKTIPSFFISHQMRIMNPLRIKPLETGSEVFNLFFFKRFRGVIVPDYQTNGLSGDLAHNLKKIDEKEIHYVGILSDFTKKQLPKEIDYLISLSGPEPQRSILEKTILSQIKELTGNIAITLGKTEVTEQFEQQNIQTYSYLTKTQREELLNKAKLVISRSGYSTIMDLAVIGTKALMIPTPGQIEQEYLAQYHHIIGTCYAVQQKNINLADDVKKAEKTAGFSGGYNVEKTVENILQVIHST